MLRHKPVLLEETLSMLPEKACFIMDGTLGHGGHTAAIVKQIKENKSSLKEEKKVIGVDRDSDMIKKAKIFLEESGDINNVYFVQGSYANFTYILQESHIEKFDFILIDIGVNMDHFKVAERGFSIKKNGPLDMRYDRSKGLSAEKRLAQSNYNDILDMFTMHADFGEKFTQRIAEELHRAKRKQKISTTEDLRMWAKDLGINDKKLAVIFQAIRIVVNGELDELSVFLKNFYKYLRPGGRCVVLTYHSGEDRMVKYSFKTLVEQGIGKLVNKKVIKPTWQEVKKNKAARSAKLRCLEIE